MRSATSPRLSRLLSCGGNARCAARPSRNIRLSSRRTSASPCPRLSARVENISKTSMRAMPTRWSKTETKSAIRTNGDFAKVSCPVPPYGASWSIWLPPISKKPNRRRKIGAGPPGCRRANIGRKSAAGFCIGPPRRSGDLRDIQFFGRSPTSKRLRPDFRGMRPKPAIILTGS